MKAVPQTNPCKRITRPIFLLGIPRSGTTILHEALAYHHALGWLSNFGNRHEILRCWEIVNRVRDWPGFRRLPLREKRQHERGSGLLGRALPMPSEAYDLWEKACGEGFRRGFLIGVSATQAERSRAHQMALRSLRLQGKGRFLAKLTGPPRITFLKSIFPDAYFIHVVRDPRAVIHSLLNVDFWIRGRGDQRPWWQGGLPAGWEEEWRRHGNTAVSLTALQCEAIFAAFAREQGELEQDHFLEIRYEDLVADPLQTIRRLLDWAGLEPCPRLLAYLQSRSRFSNLNQRHLDCLSAEDSAVIDSLLAEQLQRYGYR